MGTASDLVCFQHPPINEMALGMQFASHVHLRPLQYADIWSAFGRDEYPEYLEVPPLDSIALPDAPNQVMFQVQLVGPAPQRYWFMSPTQERLIQLQGNRLLYNWRRMDHLPDEPYPSYQSLIGKFFSAYQIFAEYAERQNQVAIPQIADLTYINHIPLPNGFDSISEVLRGSFHFDEHPAIPVLRASSHQWQYSLDDIKASMNVSANPVNTSFGDMLRLELYISGIFGEMISSGGIDEMRKRYDILHKRINELFIAITTEEAQEVWGKT